MSGPLLDDDHARVSARVVAFDLVVSVPVLGIWWMFGVVDIGVAIAVNLLRMLTCLWVLRRALAPTRGWSPACSDAQLLAADDALQRLRTRFGLPYVCSWMLGFALTVPLSSVVGDRGGVGTAELLAAGVLLVALVMLMLQTLPSVFLAALLDLRTRVSASLLERELAPRRPAQSIRRAAAANDFTLVIGLVLAIGALGGLAHVRGVRSTAVVEQQRRVELSAAQLTTARGSALDGVELVELDALPEALRAERSRRSEDEVIALYAPGEGLALAAAPLGDGRWALAAAEPDEQLAWIGLLLFGLAFAASFPTAVAGLSRSNALVDPILQLDEATRRFVDEGELEALDRIVPLQDDELGRFVTNFNGMLDMLEGLAHAAESVAAGDLSVELARSDELHRAFQGMVGRLAEVVTRLRETSLELASAAAELHALTTQQDEAGQEQAVTVQQVSGSVASLTRGAAEIADTANTTLDDAERSVSTTKLVAERIALLLGQTASVGQLLDAIREIAERSDLLALNGSLEATRAGEAGRGFALVAGEMRRLAERVAGTIEDVREHIGEIEASGTATVAAAEDSRGLAQRAAAAARTISGVTARQNVDTQQAAEGMRTVAAMVADAAVATSQTRATAEGLRLHAEQLERLLAPFRVSGDGS